MPARPVSSAFFCDFITKDGPGMAGQQPVPVCVGSPIFFRHFGDKYLRLRISILEVGGPRRGGETPQGLSCQIGVVLGREWRFS